MINRDVCLTRDRGSNYCMLCPYNYFVSNEGQCVPYNCRSWEQSYPNYIECQECINGFVLKDNACFD